MDHPRIIDLFITNPELVPKVSLCETLTYEAVQSDHIGVLLEVCGDCSSVGNTLIEKYLLKKTDWTLWEECTKVEFGNWNSENEHTEWDSVEDMYISFKAVFDECREKSVPKRNIQNVNRRQKPPWWNDRMTELKKRLNKAKRTYKRRSTQNNFKEVETIESEFKVAEEEEKDLWMESLCEKITYSSTPKEMWDTFKTLTSYQDLDGGNILPLLDKDNNPVFDLEQKCQILQDTFFGGSHLSDNNFDETFKKEIETELTDIRNKPTEDQPFDDTILNGEITLGETLASLQYLKTGKAAGPDKVFTELLLKSNDELVKAIHSLFNFSFETGTLPEDWRSADVKFLRKSGKTSYHSASAYRPISLTSCLGKCLERILTVRLNGFIEHNSIIDSDQEGFRKFHSTTGALLRLVQDIHNGFNEKSQTLAAFIDLEKAFDSVWREGLLVKLHRLGIRGQMWKWIEGFLNDRKARCCLKGQYGPMFGTSVGLPQGSVISPVLFSLYLQDIFKEIKSKGVKYADDGTIWVTGHDTTALAKAIQEDLKRIYTWTLKWRMKLNISKTEICLFTKMIDQTDSPKPEVTLLDMKIKYNSTPKLLGVVLDETLNFQKHICNIEQKANKAIGTLRQVKYVENINTKKFIQLYQALVLPIIEYACPVWQCADASKLEDIQRKGLAMCLGAIGTSGREALEVELNITPLEVRRTELSLREAARILSKDVDVPIRCAWENWLETDRTEKYMSPFGKMLLQLEDIKAETGNKNLNLEPDFSFRETLYPTINKPDYWSRLGSSKSRTQSQKDESRAVISGTLESCSPDTLIAFTDGSCHPNPGPCGAGACVYLPHETAPVLLKQPVSKRGSILLGEMIAIKMVLDFILEKLHQKMEIKDVLILSDSQSSVGLLTLGWEPTQHKTTSKEILTELKQIQNKGIQVDIRWTPGHADIQGNEEADRLAKEASKEAETMTDEDRTISQAEFKQAAKAHSMITWQKQWEVSEKGRFLYDLKPKVSKKTVFDFPDKKTYNQIAQLRTGYAKLNDYLYKIGVSETKNCRCGEIETVEHYLLSCENYFNERESMRTTLFYQTGISELTTEVLLGINDSDLKKNHERTILSALGDFITQTARF